MTDPDLAKQLITYADAITGFSWTQAVVFCFAVARNDSFTKTVTRTDGAVAATLGIFVGTGIYAFLASRCLASATTLDPATGNAVDVVHWVQLTRTLVIVGGGALSLFALWATKLGSRRSPSR